MNCVEEGTKMVTSLVDGSLSEGQSRSFYNPSTRSKLKSFENMAHKTKLKCRSGDTVTVHMNPELVFRRELVLANCREDVTVKKVLSFLGMATSTRLTGYSIKHPIIEYQNRYSVTRKTLFYENNDKIFRTINN